MMKLKKWESRTIAATRNKVQWMHKGVNLKALQNLLQPLARRVESPHLVQNQVLRNAVRHPHLYAEKRRRIEGSDNMEKKLKASTIALMTKYKGEIDLHEPISKKNEKEVTLKLLQFFTDLEASLSFDLDEGVKVDRQLMDDVSNAVDDFNLESEEHIEFEVINEVLFG